MDVVPVNDEAIDAEWDHKDARTHNNNDDANVLTLVDSVIGRQELTDFGVLVVKSTYSEDWRSGNQLNDSD